MESKKVYVLTIEWHWNGPTQFEVLAIFDNKEKAINALAKEKETIINEYATNDPDFEVETDTETEFEYQKNEWEEYYRRTLPSHRRTLQHLTRRTCHSNEGRRMQ